MRQFETGATRNTDTDQLDYEAFLSPAVLRCYAAYMAKHAKQKNGELRPGDNWQKGIPKNAYMKSGLRHAMDWWLEHRGETSRDGLKDALCAVIFNASGYLFELLKEEKKEEIPLPTPLPAPLKACNSIFEVKCPICDNELICFANVDSYIKHLAVAHTSKQLVDWCNEHPGRIIAHP